MFRSVVLMILATVMGFTQHLTILTEEDPPYSFTGQDGQPMGFGVDVVELLQDKLGHKAPINVVPWARAYSAIQQGRNTVVFAMSRTAERNDLFKWVGPIIENDWVLIGDKAAGIKLANLQDAKRLGKIGTVRGYAWTEFLFKQGFVNLDQVSERKFNVLKLRAGRVQAFVSADLSYKSEILSNGLDPDHFEVLLRFNTVQMYIAFSKDTDDALVAEWQQTLDRMKRSGAFLKIVQKWFP
jgi:polar amino acid transport system substrate-binding protein